MTARRAVVTGACGGIGAATVRALAATGWHVTGVDLVEPPDALEIDSFVLADLGEPGGVDEVVRQVAGGGGLDALVNGAALQLDLALVDTTDDDWDAVMAVNLRSAFRLVRDLHPALAAARGAVVNVASVHAIATSANVAAYAVSKGALVALTRSTALELAPDGIRCNAVLPGAVRTPMLERGLSRRPHPDGPNGNLDALVERTPLGFVATPEQIAPTIIHLADTALSPYTTGQMMVVDGGATIRLGTE